MCVHSPRGENFGSRSSSMERLFVFSALYEQINTSPCSFVGKPQKLVSQERFGETNATIALKNKAEKREFSTELSFFEYSCVVTASSLNFISNNFREFNFFSSFGVERGLEYRKDSVYGNENVKYRLLETGGMKKPVLARAGNKPRRFTNKFFIERDKQDWFEQSEQAWFNILVDALIYKHFYVEFSPYVNIIPSVMEEVDLLKHYWGEDGFKERESTKSNKIFVKKGLQSVRGIECYDSIEETTECFRLFNKDAHQKIKHDGLRSILEKIKCDDALREILQEIKNDKLLKNNNDKLLEILQKINNDKLLGILLKIENYPLQEIEDKDLREILQEIKNDKLLKNNNDKLAEILQKIKNIGNNALQEIKNKDLREILQEIKNDKLLKSNNDKLLEILQKIENDALQEINDKDLREMLQEIKNDKLLKSNNDKLSEILQKIENDALQEIKNKDLREILKKIKRDDALQEILQELKNDKRQKTQQRINCYQRAIFQKIENYPLQEIEDKDLREILKKIKDDALREILQKIKRGVIAESYGSLPITGDNIYENCFILFNSDEKTKFAKNYQIWYSVKVNKVDNELKGPVKDFFKGKSLLMDGILSLLIKKDIYRQTIDEKQCCDIYESLWYNWRYNIIQKGGQLLPKDFELHFYVHSAIPIE